MTQKETIKGDWMKTIVYICISIGIIIISVFLFDALIHPAFALIFILGGLFLLFKTCFKRYWKTMFLGALGGAFLILLHTVLMTISSDMFNYSPFGKFMRFFVDWAETVGLCSDFGCLIFAAISIPAFVMLCSLVGLLIQIALYRK